MDQVYVKDLCQHVGEEVTIKGWLYNKRSSGKVRFLLVRDGTGLVQCVLVAGDVKKDAFEIFTALNQESSLEVTGVVREDARSPGGYELQLTDLTVVQLSQDYPISPKEHGITFLLDHRHLWLRSSRPHMVMRIRDKIIRYIRDFFTERDFILIDTPILTGAVGESASTLFETEYFNEGNAYLAQTGQLYLEAACQAFGKVYNFGPTFRAEKSKTRRHLTEFWMVEGEVAFADSDENMKLQEDLIYYVVRRVLEEASKELHGLERDTGPLEKVTVPFERLSYDDAVCLLQQKGSKIQWGADLGAEDETEISKEFDGPVFVYNYPREAKAFYMPPHPQRPEVVLCDDLLAPEGYGEIIGGSQRIHDYEVLLERIKEAGFDEKNYDWYLDLRKYGTVPHSGFGLGLERTVAWICGLKHIREAIPFPRTITRLRP
ncbi:MAG: asparagine--tRNA ligase [Candidatus Glassbacteria bacterium]